MQTVADTPTATSVGHLWLSDFRCFEHVDLELAPGLTVLHGANGQGKTSLLEAIAWVPRTRSFHGIPDNMLVRSSCEQAIVRADVVSGQRTQLFEAELRYAGRNRIMCNRQPVNRARDLHGLLRVTVFAPDDLALVKDGPAVRREYLDELLGMVAVRYEAARTDFERILKQRNALLRGGVRDVESRATLDVFDERLVSAASELIRGRFRLVERLLPVAQRAYCSLASADAVVDANYIAEWSDAPMDTDIEGALRTALEQRRRGEIERGLTLVGPHRDEWRLTINGLDARQQASQGEQRTLSLALRLAGHHVVGEITGSAPVLLLDDVFSELDAQRAAALVQNLPPGQTLVTTAGEVPADVVAERRLTIAGRSIT